MEPRVSTQDYQDAIQGISIVFLMSLFSFSVTMLMIDSKLFQILFVFIWPLFVTIPVVLIFDPVSLEGTWFIVAKVSSVFMSSLFVWLTLKLPSRKWPKICRYAFFFINCVEVMIRDIQNEYYLNGVIALFVIWGIPWYKTIFVENKIVKWDSDWPWIFLYTFWNLNFSFHNYTDIHLLNFVHPVIAVFLCIFVNDWKAYCLFRAWSLNIIFTTWVVFFPFFDSCIYWEPLITYKKQIGLVYNVLTLIFTLIYVIYAIRRYLNGRNESKIEIEQVSDESEPINV